MKQPIITANIGGVWENSFHTSFYIVALSHSYHCSFFPCNTCCFFPGTPGFPRDYDSGIEFIESLYVPDKRFSICLKKMKNLKKNTGIQFIESLYVPDKSFFIYSKRIKTFQKTGIQFTESLYVPDKRCHLSFPCFTLLEETGETKRVKNKDNKMTWH